MNTIDANLVNPLTHLWNFDVQREVPGNIVVDVAYVGSRGTRLFINEQLNPAVNSRRLFSSRSSVVARTNGGDSVYHSLQSRVERNFRDGVMVRFAYTLSKAIDNISEVFLTTGGSSFQSDPFNRRLDRSVASFDAPRRAVWTFLWDLPGPKSGFWGQVAGFWTVSGIYRLQSGAVETPYIGGIDMNGDLSAFNDRPAMGNPNAPPRSVAIRASLFGVSSPTGYVDANDNPINPANARYIVDQATRTNVAGRNILRGERINRLDLSVSKAFSLPFEGHKLELRIEFFNVLNHPLFTWLSQSSDLSDGDVLSPFFNNVRLNDGGSRSGRIHVRYAF